MPIHVVVAMYPVLPGLRRYGSEQQLVRGYSGRIASVSIGSTKPGVANAQ